MDITINPINKKQYPSYLKPQKSIIAGSFGHDEKEKAPSKTNTAKAMGILAVSSVVTFLMFSKGIQKNAGKHLYKFREFLENKQKNLTEKESEKKSGLYESVIRKLNFFIQKMDSINNITSVKDILFMRIMYSTEPTKKLHQNITKLFEDLSRNTVKNSYKETKLRFDNMYKSFDSLDKIILKDSPDSVVEYKGKMYTKRELIENARGSRNIVKDAVEAFISEDAQKFRYDYIKNATSDLYSRFWDVSFKDFWSKNNKFKRKEMWQTFIAAEQVAGDKAILAERTAIARNVISYTSGDKLKLLTEYINMLDKTILPEDRKGAEIITRLKWYTYNPEIIAKNKEAFLKELDNLASHKTNKKMDEKIAKVHINNQQSYINLIKELTEDKSTGELQDMLDIYYKLAPFELSKTGASLSVKKAVESFDKSVYLENIEFFDKERDLVLGSAPTDVLTVLLSFITISCGLGYAKNKDERTSIVIKSGIPILGAITTSIISATKLVSGGKSLLLGFLSGIALNQTGNITDTYRKTLKSKNIQATGLS